MKPTSFLSFDVEALPGRAEKDHVDRLIWGKFDGEEFGIRRICTILDEYGLKGNFFIDLSGCLLYGDRAIKEAGDYLLSKGHELHVHLHSEWVIRGWGIRGSFDGAPGLNQLNAELNQRCLEFAAFKFRQLFGANPYAFRGGGFMFNAHTVAAARDAGFRCLSNFNNQRHAGMLGVEGGGAQNEPFSWGGGLCELPVDYSPEPLSADLGTYYGWFDRVVDRKEVKTFNLTLHSWSLLRRDSAFFDAVDIEHDNRLRHICEHLKENTRVSGYAEYMEGKGFDPVKVGSFRSATSPLVDGQVLVSCNICGSKFSPRDDDVCPGCSGRARHRQVVDAFRGRENPFDGGRVLACFANAVEKTSLLSHVKELKVFDVRPLAEADFQMDIQSMDVVPDESFDGFMALHVLNHVRDDRAALKEIRRILTPGGVALLTIPYRKGDKTTSLENVTEHYGADNYEKYGVGSYRRYGFDDAVSLFSEFFDVEVIEGLDPVTQQRMNVFKMVRRVE